MTNNLESSDQTVLNIDSNCVVKLKDKTSLRLRLGRIFNSNGLKSPKSPKSVSSSRGSSPSHGSPRARTRCSWHLGTYGSVENQSPCTSESGISISSSITNSASSPKSPFTSKSMCSSMWYAPDRMSNFKQASRTSRKLNPADKNISDKIYRILRRKSTGFERDDFEFLLQLSAKVNLGDQPCFK